MFTSERLIIMLGAGGVGKTTCSALVAISAAISGKRVALLSIDPAQRLADALGISLTGELSEIKLSIESPGSLHAAMLDYKQVMHSMITKFIKDEDKKTKIYENSIYHIVMNKLAGASEYMALFKLHELLNDSDFDLVVLDTPPHLHAIDFLFKPQIISRFVDNGVIRFLINPFYSITANKGLKASIYQKFMNKLEGFTGVSLMKSVTEFLYYIQEAIQGMHLMVKNNSQLLASDKTRYIGVTSYGQGSLEMFFQLIRKLNKINIELDDVILNKILPFSVANELKYADEDQQIIQLDDRMLSLLLSKYKLQQKVAKVIEDTNGRHPILIPEFDTDTLTLDIYESVALELLESFNQGLKSKNS